MPTTPDDIVNEALDLIGVEVIGDIHEGSRAAEIARRAYDPLLRWMHAQTHWNFARRQLQLGMRGDLCGQYNPNRQVPHPWAYMYEWPADCVHARFVLGLDAYALDASGSPLYSAPAWNRPAPFLVTDAPLANPIESSWDQIEGHSPESTRVVCTDQLGAVLVYTGLIQYPDAWDAGFRQAFVAALAARFALPLIGDKALARAVQSQQTAIAKEALIEARVRDGNEGWTVREHVPDWIRARTSGAVWGGWYGGWPDAARTEDAGGVY